MEGKENLDELLVSFLMNELNGDEELYVVELINSDEEIRKYYEELKTTLKITGIKEAYDQVNIDHEWARLEQAVQPNASNGSFITDGERFGNEVIKEVQLKRKTTLYRSIAILAVAASVILAIGLGWTLVEKEKPNENKVAVTLEKKPEYVPPFVRHLKNQTGTTKQFTLADGSVIDLSDKSEISFQEPFEPNKRDIRLKGKATFMVSHDPSKPFTVFTGDISTTALGTSFTVAAIEKSKEIIISLYEGKVVVNALHASDNRQKKSFYLFPGQQLKYNKTKFSAIVRNFIQENQRPVADPVVREALPIDNPSVPRYRKGSWYMFNNQSLPDVFDQLEDMYHVEIRYVTKDISKLYFIGTFNKSDSLESVLNQIASINKLIVIKKEDSYIIKKK